MHSSEQREKLFPAGHLEPHTPALQEGHVSSLLFLNSVAELFKFVPNHSPRKAYAGLPVGLPSSQGGDIVQHFLF